MAPPPGKPGGAPRFAVIAVTLAGLLVLAAGGLLSLALRDNPKGAAGTLLSSAIGGPFHLVDQNGKPFSDADLKGKWHLGLFGYTPSPHACPTPLTALRPGLRR